MCGIVGVWDPTLGPEARSALTKRLTDTLSHRGPDGHGLWADPSLPITLGHRRLAIQGLGAQGAQPMVHPQGGVLCWNGELFGALPLRRQLEADGEVFRGTSDTEILLRALGRFGLPDTLSRIDGQYALAWLHDGALWLARDPFGIRPLYYATAGVRLAFGSEQKALLPLPWVDRRPDEDALWRFLVLGRTDDLPGRTMLRHLAQLPAGHYARWDGEGLDIQRFFRATPRMTPRTTTVGIADLREELSTAVTSQLVSDVPIGATVSGGLDSSTVALYADRAHDRPPLHLFAFHDALAEVDERLYQRAVLDAAHQPKVVHWVSSSPAAFANDFDLYVHHQEEPYGDLSSYAEWCLARAARTAGVKVLLGGLGGDEAFAGYPAFLGPLFLDALGERDFSTLRTLLRVTGQVVPGSNATRTLLSAAHALLPARARHLVTALRAAAQARLSVRATATIGRNALHGWHGHDSAHSVTVGALRGALESWCVPRYMLHSDRMTLAAGVEGRVPLLAPRLVEAALSLPSALRVDGRGLKAGLRLAAEPVLPRVIFERAWKQGFHAPMGPYVAAVDERLHAGAREISHLLDEKLDWAHLTPVMRWRWGSLGNYLHWVADR